MKRFARDQVSHMHNVTFEARKVFDVNKSTRNERSIYTFSAAYASASLANFIQGVKSALGISNTICKNIVCDSVF